MDFAKNAGIYPSTECSICLEKAGNGRKMKIFNCGHANVCTDCNYVDNLCPVCK